MDQAPIDILRRYWRHDTFRPMQEEIIRSVLDGRDTLALLPTAGGKSICFQVPAMAGPGLCLVISPLIALMRDQVDGLRKKNITAFALYSGMSRKELINTLRVSSDSNCKFLYVSPERLQTDLFLEYLPGLPINLIAVDEAHCVSQWGYDFRPSYLKIAALRKELPSVPVLALTASATPDILGDIGDKLGLRQPIVFRQSFERANLSYSVFKVDSRVRKITEILQNVPGSSIVYCRTRRSAKEISDALGRQGISAGAYHAGLPLEERTRRQEDWIKDRLRVMVCTNAFGMGIDKPGVRTVIHAGIPDAIENYYQEAGRAGRDGKRAYAVLLYQEGEPEELKRLPDSRFPSMDIVRQVYQDVMNYLQLPAGSGKGNYYDFDATVFVDKFRRGGHGTDGPGLGVRDQDAGASANPVSEALNSIKALEQEGLVSFSQQVFLPAKVQFITDKRSLYDFEKDHPPLESLIHILLREYEGIFDQPTTVSEKNLSWLLRKPWEQIVAGLQELQAYRIIEYIPQKDVPQLYFFYDRARAEELHIDPVNYRTRKEQYAARIRTMLDYLENEDGCRSRLLANYFGDAAAKDCGICDNCIKRLHSLR
ncbi:MAG TPA: ATP-dependent DNA helicase RecQ [Puia sp.]|nr:ATP-dependent DNA helicase RecQ [Puia sp.]